MALQTSRRFTVRYGRRRVERSTVEATRATWHAEPAGHAAGSAQGGRRFPLNVGNRLRNAHRFPESRHRSSVVGPRRIDSLPRCPRPLVGRRPRYAAGNTGPSRFLHCVGESDEDVSVRFSKIELYVHCSRYHPDGASSGCHFDGRRWAQNYSAFLQVGDFHTLSNLLNIVAPSLKPRLVGSS